MVNTVESTKVQVWILSRFTYTTRNFENIYVVRDVVGTTANLLHSAANALYEGEGPTPFLT